MKNKKGNIAVIAIVIVIAAITAGTIGWMVAKKSQPAIQQPITQKADVIATPANWKTYTSSTFNFSVSLPEDWKAVYPNDGTLYELDNGNFNNERPEYGLLGIVSSPDKKEKITFTNSLLEDAQIRECAIKLSDINNQKVKEITCPANYVADVSMGPARLNYEFVNKNLHIEFREKTPTTDKVIASIKFK